MEYVEALAAVAWLALLAILTIPLVVCKSDVASPTVISSNASPAPATLSHIKAEVSLGLTFRIWFALGLVVGSEKTLLLMLKVTVPVPSGFIVRAWLVPVVVMLLPSIVTLSILANPLSSVRLPPPTSSPFATLKSLSVI